MSAERENVINLVRDRLIYIPETGKCFWIWNNPAHPQLIGQEAGTIRNRKGRQRWYIKIASKTYPRARIAFISMMNRIPLMVDHINGDTLDDRWENLREATPAQNCWNIGGRKKNSQLPMGVRKIGKGRYQARVAAHRKTYSKIFRTVDEAHDFYLKLKAELHGEFKGRVYGPSKTA